MSNAFNRIPTYTEALVTKGAITRGWYSFFLGLLKGQPTGPAAPVAVTSSPFTYLAAQGGSLIVSGGTTTQIQFTRGDGNFYVVGTTGGMFALSQGDSLVVTYSVGPPTVTWVPR